MDSQICCLTGNLFTGGDIPRHYIGVDDDNGRYPICADVWTAFLNENSTPQDADDTVLVFSSATPDEVERHVSARFIRTRSGRWSNALAFMSHWQKCRDEAIAAEAAVRAKCLESYVRGKVPAFDEM